MDMSNTVLSVIFPLVLFGRKGKQYLNNLFIWVLTSLSTLYMSSHDV